MESTKLSFDEFKKRADKTETKDALQSIRGGQAEVVSAADEGGCHGYGGQLVKVLTGYYSW